MTTLRAILVCFLFILLGVGIVINSYGLIRAFWTMANQNDMIVSTFGYVGLGALFCGTAGVSLWRLAK